MSLAIAVAILALAAALAAIPRRTRKPAALVSLLAILGSLTAVAYAGGKVAQPAQGSNGPLALVVPAGLGEPDEYHLPLDVWRAEHPLYVRSSEYGVEECLDCHDEPDTFCNQCHAYVGAALFAAPAFVAAPVSAQSVATLEASAESDAAQPPLEATLETPGNADTAQPPLEATLRTPSYSSEVQPLFEERCGACHIRRTRGDLNMATYDDLLAGGQHGPPVTPGDAEGSLIIQVLRAPREDLNISQMPTIEGQRLTEEEIDLIARWIDAGAPAS